MTYDEALSAKLDAEDEYNQSIREAEMGLGIAEDVFEQAEAQFNDSVESAELALYNANDLFRARIEGTYP
jgi:hypothetical protein